MFTETKRNNVEVKRGEFRIGARCACAIKLLLLVALVSWRLRRRAAPPALPHCEPPSRSPAPLRLQWIRWAAEIILLSSIAATTMVLGWSLRPTQASRPVLPSEVSVGLPVVGDGRGIVPIDKLVWIEAHEKPVNDYISPDLIKLPLVPAEDVSRVVLVVQFARPLDRQTEAKIKVNIPADVEFVDCESFRPRVTCTPYKRYSERLRGPIGDVSNRYIEIQTVIPAADSVLATVLDFRAPAGLSIRTAGAYAGVRFPDYWLADGDIDAPADRVQRRSGPLPVPPPYEVDAVYVMSDGDKLSWTTTPSLTGDRVTAWKYPYSPQGGRPMPPPIATGDNLALLDQEANETFYSGIVLGIGGGCLVALAQMVLRWPRQND